MSILRSLFGGLPNSCTDPLFGALVRRDEQWSGQMTWEHTPIPFALTVHRADAVPSRVDRAVFEELQRNYPAMRSALQGALHDLWSTVPGANGPDFPGIGSSLDLWAKLQLQGVSLHPDGHVELIYGFADESLSEGAFIVAAHGTDIEPLEYVD